MISGPTGAGGLPVPHARTNPNNRNEIRRVRAFFDAVINFLVAQITSCKRTRDTAAAAGCGKVIKATSRSTAQASGTPSLQHYGNWWEREKQPPIGRCQAKGTSGHGL